MCKKMSTKQAEIAGLKLELLRLDKLAQPTSAQAERMTTCINLLSEAGINEFEIDLLMDNHSIMIVKAATVRKLTAGERFLINQYLAEAHVDCLRDCDKMVLALRGFNGVTTWTYQKVASWFNDLREDGINPIEEFKSIINA